MPSTDDSELSTISSITFSESHETSSEVTVKIEGGPSAGTRGRRRAAHGPDEEQALFTTYFRWTEQTKKRGRPRKDGKRKRGRKTRRMICNFCKLDEPYNTFRIEDHASKCIEYARAREVVKDFSHDLFVMSRDDAAGSSVEEVTYQLLNQFDVLRSERFERIQSMRDTLVADYMQFWQQYQNWRRVAEAKVSQLRHSGRPRDAQRLAHVLLSPKFDYGQFELMYQVPLGEEVLKITGINTIQRQQGFSVADGSAALAGPESLSGNESDHGPACQPAEDIDFDGEHEPVCAEMMNADQSCEVCDSPEDDSEMLLCDSCDSAYHTFCIGLKEVPEGRWFCEDCRPSRASASPSASGRAFGDAKSGGERGTGGIRHSSGEISQYHELARPVDLEATKVWFTKPPIPMSQARREMQWICQTRSGVTFCLHCDCPKAIIPTLNLSSAGATHDGIPSFFHTDPFENGNALEHFQRSHGEQNATMEEIVTKYGTEVRHEDSIMPRLNKWDIAAHNNSVRLWYHHLVLEWESLLKDGAEVAAQRLQLEQSDRTVLASSLTGPTCIFPWPADSQQFWAVMCSSPHCHQDRFAKHPLRGGKKVALAHFKDHGLALTRRQMLLIFGYKVINDLPGQLGCGEHKGPK